MIYKNNIAIFFIISSIFMLIPFQNCSKVAITALPSQAEVLPVAKPNVTAQSCVNAKSLQPEKTKFVFIIDLSRSNLGEFFKDDLLFNGRLTTGQRYSFFSSELGTDPDGKRFDALKDFVSTCGNRDLNTEYSVIGFSDLAGNIQTNGQSKTLICQPSFYSGTTAIQKIDEMQLLANTERTIYERFKKPTTPYSSSVVAPLLSKQTNYVAATDCLSQTIENDLMSASSAVNYQVFFVSDGAAVADSTGCESTSVIDKVKCYTDLMDAKLNYTMKLSSALSKNIRIHSIYYSKSGNRDTNIENYMKYLSIVGQTNEPINLGNMSNATSGSQNPFCKLLSVDRSLVYKTNSIVAVNLNRIQIGTRMMLDSDADGITDEDEKNIFHSDPLNPRSMVPGVLDGICKILGGREKCIEEKSKITCNAQLINQFNMSDCDVKILKLDQYATNPNLAGIDSDNDGIPDYIEILKGLNPLSTDSNTDIDGDGLTNAEELSLGLDPFFPDKNTLPPFVFSSTFTDTISGCDNGGWTYHLDSIMTTVGPNQVMMYFKTISQNSINESEFRMHTLNFEFIQDTKNKNQFLPTAATPLIQPSDFIVVEKKVSTP